MIVLAFLINAFTWRGQADRTVARRHHKSRYAAEAERRDEGVIETPYPPSWVDKESMKTVIAEPLHNRVVLACKAVGYPEPEIKWTKDGIKIEDDNVQKQDAFNYYKVNKAKQRLVITQLQKAHEGKYTCIISNTYGTINHTYIVESLEHNIYGPKIIEKPYNQTIVVGMDAYFRCDVDAGALAPVINWAKAKDVNNLDKSSKDSFILISGYENKNELIIHNASKKDSGLYVCFVQNSAGRAMAKAHLTVLADFEAVEHPPENITALTGSDVNFHCRTPLDIRPFISWVRIYEADIQTLAEQTEVLRLENVTASDAGEYACVIGTHAHNSFWETAFLSVTEVDPMMQTRIGHPHHTKLIVIVICVSALAVVCFVVVIVTYRRMRRERMKKLQAIQSAQAITAWTKKIIVERTNLSHPDSPIVAPVVRIERQPSSSRMRLGSENTTLTTLSEYELPMDPDWEFPRENLAIGKTLGEGAFGKVLQADALHLKQPGVASIVAVKMLKEGHTDTEMIDLVSEMDMMKVIGRHMNIINLLGVCTQDGPLYVIVEFAEHGNLRDFLRKHRPASGYERANGEKPPLTEKQLVSFSRQIAKGMEYLGSKKCIHRDLAARNVLVADGYVLKIADFGLARDVHSNDYYRKMGDGRLPVKWMAPEALFHRRYTIQSDVWSFGILLWEIMTLGGTPYPSVPSIEKLFQLLREGHRMEKPPQCSLQLYMLMRDCWHFYPNQRPTFAELVDCLQKILEVSCEEEYLDLGLPALDTPPSSDETCAIEQSAAKFFQIQNQPLQFHNHHYDQDNNWSPDQGFGSASGSGFCPSEGVSEDFPLTYTTVSHSQGSPGTSTPIYSTFQPRSQRGPEYQNQPNIMYSHQTSMPNNYMSDESLPPPPDMGLKYVQQTSLPNGDYNGTNYPMCDYNRPIRTVNNNSQQQSFQHGNEYLHTPPSRLRIEDGLDRMPKYIQTHPGHSNLYGQVLNLPPSYNPNNRADKVESQYTDDLNVDDYRERYSDHFVSSQL